MKLILILLSSSAGGFGSLYKGNLVDGTLIAVKKLDRVLPHGEEEFVTEMNTIGSMHHVNSVVYVDTVQRGHNGNSLLLQYNKFSLPSMCPWELLRKDEHQPHLNVIFVYSIHRYIFKIY